MNTPKQISSIWDLYSNFIDCNISKDYAYETALSDFKAFYQQNLNALNLIKSPYSSALVDAVDMIAQRFFEEVTKFTPKIYGNMKSPIQLEIFLLFGANNWIQASYGGCFLVSNYSIAHFLGGEKLATMYENDEIEANWIRLQADILDKAFSIFCRICQNFAELTRFSMNFNKH